MKMTMLLMIISIALGSVGQSFASGSEEAVAAPTQLSVGGLDAFRYWIVKKLVVDIDQTLQEQGINSSMCTFRQYQPTKDFSYRGVGPCLVKDFLISMKSDKSAGTIYAWIKDHQGRLHPVEIQWRPPLGGWSHLIKQIIEMRLERPLYWVRDHVWKMDLNKIRYNEFILGDLKIILPEDPEALAVLAEKGGSWAKNYLSQLSEVSLSLKTSGIDQGKVIFSGDMVLTHRPSDDGNSQEATVHLRTNINVMLLKRPFFLQAKVRTSGAGVDVPVPAAEELP